MYYSFYHRCTLHYGCYVMTFKTHEQIVTEYYLECILLYEQAYATFDNYELRNYYLSKAFNAWLTLRNYQEDHNLPWEFYINLPSSAELNIRFENIKDLIDDKHRAEIAEELKIAEQQLNKMT